MIAPSHWVWGRFYMVNMLYAQIGAVFVVLACVFAFLKGDDPERTGAGAFIFGWFASILVQQELPEYSLIGVFVLDVAMLAVFCALAWKSRRSWPVWAAALQLISVMSNTIVLIAPQTPLASQLTVVNLAGYGVLICIAVGTFWAWQERKASRGIE